MFTYQYLVIDDEKSERDTLIKLIKDFNASPETQEYLEQIFGLGIHLDLLRSRNGKNEDYGLFSDMLNADLIFLDLYFGNETPMGKDLLEISKNNNKVVRNIIILTNFLGEIKYDEYQNLLGQLSKPIQLSELLNCIIQFHISKHDLKSVCDSDKIFIPATKSVRNPVTNGNESAPSNGRTIFYEDILCVKTGGRETLLYMKNKTVLRYDVNVVGMKQIEEKSNRVIQRVNNQFAINTAIKAWEQYYENLIGSCVYSSEFDHFLLNKGLIREHFKIKGAFEPYIRNTLPNREK